MAGPSPLNVLLYYPNLIGEFKWLITAAARTYCFTVVHFFLFAVLLLSRESVVSA